MKNTQVIAGFPGVGKSFIYSSSNSGLILDSDSSLFSWIEVDGEKVRNPQFPYNYMAHIKENYGQARIIFVSTHKAVLQALEEEKIPYTLVHPHRSLKDEYLKRYILRGSDANFLCALIDHWDAFHNDLEKANPYRRIILESGQYLRDVL